MTTNRLEVIAFDVIETLAPLDPVAAAMREVGFPAHALPIFFAQMLRDAFALEIAGEFKPFKEVAEATLEVVAASLQVNAGKDELVRVMRTFEQLEAAEDVAPALKAAREAGVRVVTLTNGSAKNTHALLARAGLVEHVERSISIDEVKHWKPSLAVYRYAVNQCAVPADAIALVAAHAWDTQGARSAGLRTGWVARKDPKPSRAFASADVQGASLDEVVRHLLEKFS